VKQISELIYCRTVHELSLIKFHPVKYPCNLDCRGSRIADTPASEIAGVFDLIDGSPDKDVGFNLNGIKVVKSWDAAATRGGRCR
jgi:hypothetical protein